MSIDYKQMADRYADQYSIPRSIFSSLISQESSWNPNALGKSGDAGLTQLTPRIYKSLGVNPWIPSENLEGGARFLSSLFKKYGNWRDALSHYNAGFNLSAGRGYADKILSKAGVDAMPSQSFTPILDALKNGDDLSKIPEVTRPPSDQEKQLPDKSVMDSAEEDGMVKTFFKKFGLWVLAGFLILIGVWRVIK